MAKALEQLPLSASEPPALPEIHDTQAGGDSDQRPSDEAAGATSPATTSAGLVAAETPSPSPTPRPLRGRHPSEQRFIIRQVAIKCATDLVASRQVKLEELFRYAARITAWIYYEGGSKKKEDAA